MAVNSEVLAKGALEKVKWAAYHAKINDPHFGEGTEADKKRALRTAFRGALTLNPKQDVRMAAKAGIDLANEDLWDAAFPG